MNIVEIVRKHVIKRYRQRDSSKEMNMYEMHVKYVVEYALQLADKLDADKEIVEIAALLHDIARLDGSNENHHIEGAEYAEKFLREKGYDEKRIEQIKHCIITHRGSVSIPKETVEAECLSSADAMDHFRNIPEMLYFVYVELDKSHEEGSKMVREKLERSYRKMIPDAKEIVKDKYEAALKILK